MRIALYTVIVGNYDNLRKPALIDPSCKYVCFTDRPRSVVPWEILPFPSPSGMEHSRSARVPRCMPHLFLDTDVSVYMDGAFKPNCNAGQIMRILGDADIALFEHPNHHKSLEDEMAFYKKLHGFVPDHVADAVTKYKAQGVPKLNEFWAGGIVIRRHNERTAAFNELWYTEFMHGSHNDQLALYASIAKSPQLTVKTIHGHILEDGRFGYCLHATSGCGDNPDYAQENAYWNEVFARIQRLAS